MTQSPLVLRARQADRKRRVRLLARLQAIRLAKGLTVQDIGRITGLNPRTFYDALAGSSRVSYTTLGAMAEALGHRLVVGIEAPKSAEITGRHTLTEADSVLIEH